MKKYFTIAVILLLTFFTFYGNNSEAKGKTSAFFKGTINGKQVKFLSGEVAMAGSRPYLLVSLLQGNNHWILDVKGAGGAAGPSRLNYFIMQRRGRRLYASYRGNSSVQVKNVKGRKKWLGTPVTLRLADKKGNRATIKGLLYWDTSVLPSKPKGGTLAVYFDAAPLAPASAKIEPWNQGVQIQKLFVIRPGVTLNLTVKFPSMKNGTYRGSMQAMYFRMVEGRLVTSFLKSSNVNVVITDGNVRFAGRVTDKKNETHVIRGSFNR